MNPRVGDLLRFSPMSFDSMITNRPKLAVVIKFDLAGFYEILWNDGKTSIFSDEFTKRNFEATE